MSGLQVAWLCASFFIGFYFIEIIGAALKVRISFFINIIFAFIGVLTAYSLMFHA